MKCLNCIHCKIYQQKRGLNGYEKDDIAENTKKQLTLLFIGVSRITENAICSTFIVKHKCTSLT